MAWRLARSLTTLRNQVNAAAPGRNKKHDGAIGDAAHAASNSEHNPNSAGVVRAIDITVDRAAGVDGDLLARRIIEELDRRGIKGYVIFNRRIRSTYVQRGVWRRYTGHPHDQHVHVSVIDGYDSTRQWNIDGIGGGTASRPTAGKQPAPAPAVPTVKAPPYPLPDGHYCYYNPKGYATWHDGHLSKGDARGNAAILEWQRRMKARGWTIDADGYYGDGTNKTAGDFQADKKLATDGIIGPITWKAAFEAPVTP